MKAIILSISIIILILLGADFPLSYHFILRSILVYHSNPFYLAMNNVTDPLTLHMPAFS